MKKYLMSFAVLMMGAALLTACSSDDDKDTPHYVPFDISNGFFLVGSGNTRAGIDGNLSYIDYSSGTVKPDAFKAANGKSLGKTANYVAIYGSKLYIVVDQEATIWVCDKNTLKVQNQISTTKLLGEGDGASPRALVGYDGKVYFTCYGDSYNGGVGNVTALDTLNFQIQAGYKVGSYPDGLTIADGKIFVANSDYGNGVKPSISKIDLSAPAVTTITDPVITNPMQILTVGSDVYYLDYGTYDENWNQTGAGVRKITQSGQVSKVVDGTAMCSDGSKIYTVNAPFGGSGINYLIYDIASGKTTSWNPDKVFSPAMIAADPNNGDIFIVSYAEDPDTGYPSYKLPSYTNHYNSAGQFVRTYQNTATGPISIAFNTEVRYVINQ